MFCANCGNKLNEGVNFCPECGHGIKGDAVKTEKKQAPSTELLFTLKPVFIPSLTILAVLPIQLFMTVWAGGFFGGFSSVGLKALNIPFPPWAPFAFFAALAFFGIPLLAYISTKRTYEKTEYRFYGDRLEYFEGFWNVESKVVKYSKIVEANLYKGIFQRQHGVGTIILSTPAIAVSSRSRNFSGIRIKNVKDVDSAYEAVLKLID